MCFNCVCGRSCDALLMFVQLPRVTPEKPYIRPEGEVSSSITDHRIHPCILPSCLPSCLLSIIFASVRSFIHLHLRAPSGLSISNARRGQHELARPARPNASTHLLPGFCDTNTKHTRNAISRIQEHGQHPSSMSWRDSETCPTSFPEGILAGFQAFRDQIDGDCNLKMFFLHILVPRCRWIGARPEKRQDKYHTRTHPTRGLSFRD